MKNSKKNKQKNKKNITKKNKQKMYFLKGGGEGTFFGGPYYNIWTKGVGPYFQYFSSMFSGFGKKLALLSLSLSPQALMAGAVAGAASSFVDVAASKTKEIEGITKAIAEPFNKLNNVTNAASSAVSGATNAAKGASKTVSKALKGGSRRHK